MVKQTEKHRDVSFVELVRFMSYLEEKYGAVAEMHISSDEDDSLDALLCITCVGCCPVHRNPRHNTFSSRKVPYKELHKVPEVLLDMFYDILDQIDGKCPECLEIAATFSRN
jgi:heterodisulfide reductase subunit C